MIFDPVFVWRLFTVTGIAFVAIVSLFVIRDRLRRNVPLDLNQHPDSIARSILRLARTTGQPRRANRSARRSGVSPSLWSHLWRSPAVRRTVKLQITVLVLLSMVEVFANAAPWVVVYRGLPFFPIFRTYQESVFGGDVDLSIDYRDPYLQKLIAEWGGFMLWPPIRFSHDNHDFMTATPSPSPPTWLLSEEQCKAVVERWGLTGCRDLEYHWLGTDEQGRDVAARVLYGARLYLILVILVVAMVTFTGIAIAMGRYLLGVRQRSVALVSIVAR